MIIKIRHRRVPWVFNELSSPWVFNAQVDQSVTWSTTWLFFGKLVNRCSHIAPVHVRIAWLNYLQNVLSLSRYLVNIASKLKFWCCCHYCISVGWSRACKIRDCLLRSPLRPCCCHVRLFKAAENRSVSRRISSPEAGKVEPRPWEHLSSTFPSRNVLQRSHTPCFSSVLEKLHWLPVEWHIYGLKLPLNS